uniref:cellulose 1,4-beta-cellobiosidase (non-reducing end) n=1 Tax=uncultured symbiotic protist of Neotermes koshunensis TaxID=403660 RepID=A4UWW8_9EUKA|nr:putative glycosyl hydrolase family7 [uncultured symbiotic protist of Neotermes koshunensis]
MLLLLSAFSACETRPSLTWQQCTRAGCTPVTGSVVSDTDQRPSAGADINNADIGVSSSGGSLQQNLVTTGSLGKIIGSRLYLMDSAGSKYQLFNLVGKEITYDVTMTSIGCAVNAALYTVEMPAGGEAQFGGAAGGSGYCDANFVKSKGSSKAGCAEFDIQEANFYGMVFTSHPCQSPGQVGQGGGSCQSDGCGFNGYRYGARDFWTSQINPRSRLTVITQFVGSAGTLTEVRRKYIQGGKVIQNPTVNVYSNGNFNSLSEAFCKAAGHPLSGWTSFAAMGQSFGRGHVLVFSLWDSFDMGWLSGSTEYGPSTSSDKLEAETHLDAKVIWSSIKYGDIDTTY